MHARLIHRFNYSYSQPILLGPHRFCLRPRPHGFQRLIDFKLPHLGRLFIRVVLNSHNFPCILHSWRIDIFLSL